MKVVEINTVKRSLILDNEALTQYFERIMKENQINGRVLGCIVIPDHHRLYWLELRYNNLFTRYSILCQKRILFKCFCKEAYRKPEAFQQERSRMEHEIEAELCKNVEGTTLAFVVFDSIWTVQQVRHLVT